MMVNSETDEREWALRPSFFEKYYGNGGLENEIIWIGSCNGYRTDQLVSVFSNSGASAVIGHTDSVLTNYDRLLHGAFVYSLMWGDTVSDALAFAKSIWYETDQAYWSAYNSGAVRESCATAMIYPGGEDVQLIQLEGNLGTLSGVVTDSKTGNPVENASVSIANADAKTYGATTDADGTFTIKCPVDDYQIVVSADGYESYQPKEFLSSDHVVEAGSEGQPIEIQLTPTLSESDLKNLVAAYGTISVWEYHDYDGNGMNEAYAIMTTTTSGGDLDIDAVYYVSADGNVQLMSNTIDGFLYESNDGYYRQTQGKGFLWSDYGAGGSGWTTILYGVKDDGTPYELDLSRNIQGFYEDENGFYTTENEFMDGGGHLYPEVSLIYDSATQQFTKGARRDEDLTDEIAEVTTEAASDDWKSAYRQVLSSVTDSGAQFATIYIDGDEIPELVVAYDSAHAAACEIYTYYNGSAVKLKSSYGEQFGSYGGIAYKPYGNSFDSSYYGMGLGTDEIYTINNGAAQVECNIKSYEQYQGDDDVIQYWINDIETSEADYNAKLKAYGVSSMTYVGYNEGMVALNSTNMNTYL
jgi:hypothetical protein